MVNGRTLVGDLETTLAHAESHRIHIDHARVRLVLAGFIHHCINVLEKRYLNVYLFTSSLTN